MSTPPSLSPNIPYPLLANSNSDTDSDTDSDISGLRHVNYRDLEIPSLLRTTQRTDKMSLNDSFESSIDAFDIKDPFPLPTEDIKNPFTPLPQVPEFDKLQYDSLLKAPRAQADRFSLKIKTIRENYTNYRIQKANIECLETLYDQKTITKKQKEKLTVARSHIKAVYIALRKAAAEISQIIETQKAIRPHLPIPKDHPEADHMPDEVVTLVKTHLGTDKCTIETLKPMWSRAAAISDHLQLSHKQFLTVIMSLLPEEPFEYLRTLILSGSKLDDIASDMARRYVHRDDFNTALDELENFTRMAREPIHSACHRLRHLIKKASILIPENEKAIHEKYTMSQKLRCMITERTRKKLSEKENAHRKQGFTMHPEHILELIDEDERLYGMPEESVNIPVSLYNVTAQESEKDAQIEALNDFASLLIQENMPQEDVELNAAMKSVKFRDSSRPRNAPYGLKKSVNEQYQKYQQAKLPIKAALTPMTLSAPSKPPPQFPTFSPTYPSQASGPLPDGDEQMMDVSSTRQSRPRTREEAEKQRRMNEYRQRNRSYNTYLRDQSKNGSQARARAMTPTSFLENRERARHTKQLEDEIKRLKEQNYRQSKSPHQGHSHHHSSSRPGSQSRDKHYNNNGYRNKSQEKGYRSNSKGSNYRSNSGYRKNQHGNTFNTHDHTIVNVCGDCGIHGEHSSYVCNQIQVKLGKKHQEN